jgi:hypothetical protein
MEFGNPNFSSPQEMQEIKRHKSNPCKTANNWVYQEHISNHQVSPLKSTRLLMICFLNGYVSFLLLWDLLLHKEIKIKT